MAAGTAYAKRFAGGFADNAGGGTPIDSAFLNAVETALLQLIASAPTADGQVAQWDNANTRFGPALLLNKNVDPAAAIAKSKLDFTGANGIVNADIAGAAAIARSKLSFGSGLVDADIAAAAALGIAKLAGYPSDGTKFLAGDATWKVPTAIPTTDRLVIRPLAANTPGNGVVSAVASAAYGFRFYLPTQVSITNFYHTVIVQSGNYDFGIYDTSFNAVWRYGSHACPAASTVTPITVAVSAGSPVTSPLVLNAGFYYFVATADNVTMQVGGFAPTASGMSANRSGVSGVAALDAKPLVFSKAASFPLPASIATPTAWDYFTAFGTPLIAEGV